MQATPPTRENLPVNNEPTKEEPCPSVVFYRCEPHGHARSHDATTKAEVARRLAELLDFNYAGEFDPVQRPPGRLYFVPTDTLYGVDDALRLGIRSPDDLFGGVVPHPFVATKAITHPLVDADALAPSGWSPDSRPACAKWCCRLFRLHRAGCTARGRTPARARVRCASRRPRGVGGGGQAVVSTRRSWRPVSASLDTEALSRQGIVLERESRGSDDTQRRPGRSRRRDGELLGTQRADSATSGRGCLWRIALVRRARRLRRAAALDLAGGGAHRDRAGAGATTRAALMFFPGMFASRCNYDIAQGLDDEGRWRSGVLEQSWRIGGASGAEVAALRRLPRRSGAASGARVDRRNLRRGRRRAAPTPSVYFDGIDEHVGPLAKYVQARTVWRRDDEPIEIAVDASTSPERCVTPAHAGARRAVRAWLGRQPGAVPGARARRSRRWVACA